MTDNALLLQSYSAAFDTGASEQLLATLAGYDYENLPACAAADASLLATDVKKDLKGVYLWAVGDYAWVPESSRALLVSLLNNRHNGKYGAPLKTEVFLNSTSAVAGGSKAVSSYDTVEARVSYLLYTMLHHNYNPCSGNMYPVSEQQASPVQGGGQAVVELASAYVDLARKTATFSADFGYFLTGAFDLTINIGMCVSWPQRLSPHTTDITVKSAGTPSRKLLSAQSK